ncbi:MAG: sialate O-acetylesterase [Prevotella sp.]
MKTKNKSRFVLILGLLLTVIGANAKIKLQPLFSSNMVLQQQFMAPLWGEAKSGKVVTVLTSWDNKTYSTKADSNGHWSLKVATPKAGGPYNITISDSSPVVLRNVLIGEVWLCTGQSNMEMPMQGWDIKMNEEEIARSGKYTGIRLLQLDEVTSPSEETGFTARNDGWMTCSPDVVKDFSATGFFFGKNINEHQQVPVGLIMTCWGGTPVESWMSGDKLKEFTEYRNQIIDLQKQPKDKAARENKYKQEYQTWLINARKKEGSLDAAGRDVFAAADYDDSNWSVMNLPTQIEKAGQPDFDGIMWFRKTIELPAKWAGKNLELDLAAIDDNDITYFNGKEIGRTEGFNVHRHYVVPGKLVKKGKNVITVFALDTGGEGGIWGEAKEMSIALKGKAQTMSLAGDWRFNPSTDLRTAPAMPKNFAGNPGIPSVLFNQMIHPLIPFAVRGAIWYQGEANENRAYQYRELLPAMIHDWRERWGYTFPFYIMQLANFRERHAQPVECQWAELREAQLLTALHTDNCAMAVNIDIGNPANIHPTTKDEVGRRLSLLARALTYKENIAYSGPIYDSYQLESGQVRLSFRHTEGGLKTTDGKALRGFAIAGPDHQFHWANATIDDNTIVVSSPDVKEPVAVRYAWDDNPDCNLTNSSDLPASPFRTDDWPGITFGVK